MRKSVLVIINNNKYYCEPVTARLLLKKGQAYVEEIHPFSIRLKDKGKVKIRRGKVYIADD